MVLYYYFGNCSIYLIRNLVFQCFYIRRPAWQFASFVRLHTKLKRQPAQYLHQMPLTTVVMFRQRIYRFSFNINMLHINMLDHCYTKVYTQKCIAFVVANFIRLCQLKHVETRILINSILLNNGLYYAAIQGIKLSHLV